ncbi:MAG: hypothetical protein LH645_13060 [Actinomycetia bacterium]|nr:hypothetical protein [Actinomycetes bacterium]
METTIQAPSGRRLVVRFGSEAETLNVAAFGYFAGPGQSVKIMIGGPGYFEASRQDPDFRPSVVVAREVFQGLEMVTARHEKGTNVLVGVLGPYHEVVYAVGGPSPSMEQLRAALMRFDFRDEPSGMLVDPAGSSDLIQVGENVDISFSNGFDLSVSDPEAGRKLLPEFSGATTQYGEMWKEIVSFGDDAAMEYLKLILGCPTATGELVLHDEREERQNDAVKWLSEVSLAWEV